MAGIGTTLETGHHIITRSKYVHNLTFAFITPLQSQQDINLFCFHFLSLSFLFNLFCFLFKAARHLLQRPYTVRDQPAIVNLRLRMFSI